MFCGPEELQCLLYFTLTANVFSFSFTLGGWGEGVGVVSNAPVREYQRKERERGEGESSSPPKGDMMLRELTVHEKMLADHLLILYKV